MSERLRVLAMSVLTRIMETPKGHVRAAIRGEAAALRFPRKNMSVIFRREDGMVRLEIWTGGDKQFVCIEHHALPSDLEQQASAVLDAL